MDLTSNIVVLKVVGASFEMSTKMYDLVSHWNIPDGVSDAPRDFDSFPIGVFRRSGMVLVSSQLVNEAASSPEPDLYTRALVMPLKSWRVVKSGAREGGFWFHSQCRRVSSVREGQFMLITHLRLLYGRVPMDSGRIEEESRGSCQAKVCRTAILIRNLIGRDCILGSITTWLGIGSQICLQIRCRKIS